MIVFKRLTVRSLLIVVAAFFLLSATCLHSRCAQENSLFLHTGSVYAQDYGDAIVVGSIGDARTLVPILASDGASQDIVGLIFNGLVKYDKDINLVGDLAEKWEVSDDGLFITFYLRQGVLWHDGAPFTSADVKFTFEKLIDPNVKTPYSGDFLKVKELKVIDEHTVQVEYREPFSPGLASWGMWIMPKHLLEHEDFSTTTFGRSPIGTGPYKFKVWKTAEKIELIYNADYFEGRPYIDRYIYRIIPDEATQFLELKTQGLDWSGLTPLQFRRQTDDRLFKNNFRKFRYPSFGYTYMAYNLESRKFQDRNVRWAINYAIDKNEIIKGVLMGLGRVCTGPFVPESWAFNKGVKAARYDPGKAKELLTRAGWLDTDTDGWIDKDGKMFEFTLITNQGNDSRKKVAEIIQRRLKDVGIKVKIRILEWSVFLNEFVNKKNFEALILGWGLSRDPDCYDIWHSSKTKEGEFNFVSYSNDQVDELMDEARRIFDQGDRARRYKRVHELLYEDQPYLFLYVADALPAVHKRFREIEPAPLGIGYNFIKWWVPKDKQRYAR